MKGGIYLYPATQNFPEGKLHLLYECNALAFLIEQAGGTATNGEKNILYIIPSSKHQRVPLIIDSKNMVVKALDFLKADDNMLLKA